MIRNQKICFCFVFLLFFFGKKIGMEFEFRNLRIPEFLFAIWNWKLRTTPSMFWIVRIVENKMLEFGNYWGAAAASELLGPSEFCSSPCAPVRDIHRFSDTFLNDKTQVTPMIVVPGGLLNSELHLKKFLKKSKTKQDHNVFRARRTRRQFFTS